jgi:hypothetical protein
MDNPLNPYASPESKIMIAEQNPSSFSEAEQIRHRFFKHERAIKSISLIFTLGYLFLGVLLLVLMIDAIKLSNPSFTIMIVIIFLPFIILYYWIARGLRKLNPSVRIPATLFSLPGIFIFPLGTVLTAYILYLIHCEKGNYIFSPEYRHVIMETPHIQIRTSFIVWILIIFLLLLFICAIIGLLCM